MAGVENVANPMSLVNEGGTPPGVIDARDFVTEGFRPRCVVDYSAVFDGLRPFVRCGVAGIQHQVRENGSVVDDFCDDPILGDPKRGFVTVARQLEDT